MTVGILEGLTSAIGDELSLLGGFRSTRTTALARGEQRIQAGEINASSVDAGLTITFPAPIPNSGGVVVGQRFRLLSDAGATTIQSGAGTASGSGGGSTITLSAGTFAAGVLPGRRFRIDSGPFSGRSAIINKRLGTANTRILLDGPGLDVDFTNESWSVHNDLTNLSAPIATVTPGGPGTIASLTLSYALGFNFTNESWEAFASAATSIPVETTLNWDNASLVLVGDTLYRYDSKTLTTLDSVRAASHLGRDGRIVAIAGNLINDGELLTIDDGQGDVRIFEFDKPATAGPDIRNVVLRITDAMTANQVRDVIINAINALAQMKIVASIGTGTGVIELRHTIPGGSGRLDVVDTVTNVTFLTDGARGLEADLGPLLDVVDAGQNYSAIDTMFQSFVVALAKGADLSRVGKNIGFPRPPPLVDDERYRRLIQASAYAPRGTVYAIELALDALLGQGNWEIFEDMSIGSPINHPCTVFIRRSDDSPINPNGKTFLDGEEARPTTNSTTIALAQTPFRVAGLRLAEEPSGRLIDRALGRDRGRELMGRLIATGTRALSSNGGDTIGNNTGGPFPANILTGDIFIIESGALKGTWITVRTPGTPLVMVANTPAAQPPEGAPIYKAPGVNFTDVNWRIVRPISNLRHYRASLEQYLEYAGGPATTQWAYTGGAENTQVLPSQSFGTDGVGTLLSANGAAGGAFYERRLRIDPTSVASFSVYASITDTVAYASGAATCFQMAFVIKDGLSHIGIGFRDDGAGHLLVGFTDNAGTFLVGPTPVQLTYNVYRTYTIEKDGGQTTSDVANVRLLIDGRVVQTVAYSALSAALGNVNALQFGTIQAGATSVQMRLKTVDWNVSTPRDFWNARVATGRTTGAGTPRRLFDNAAGGLFAAGDATPPRHRVRIYHITGSNASHGNALGEWEIETRVDADHVDLIGPKGVGLTTNANFPNRVFVPSDPTAFVFPRALGHQLIIESGPNAGTYTVTTVIDPTTPLAPVSAADLSLQFPETFANNDLLLPEIRSHVVEITPALPSPASNEGVDWHLRPVFPTDNTVFYTIVDAGTVAGPTLTLRQALPAYLSAGTVVTAEYTSVLSGHAEEEVETEILTGINNASSVDGIVVTFPGGTLTGAFVHVGDTFRVFSLVTGQPPIPSALITAVGPGDQIVLADSGLGAPITNLRWEVIAGPRNVQWSSGQYLFYPFYLFDDFGFVRDVIKILTAAGVIPDFDLLFRDASYPTGVQGLHIHGS